jgi:hypothetical protein
MIYLFYGSDTGKVRAKAFAWVEASRKKAPEAHYVRLSPEDTTLGTLEEIATASGLFFTKSLVLIDDPFSLAASGEAILDSLALLSESPNPIAILAPKLKAAETKKLEAKAEKVFKIDATLKKEGRGFNAGLVNALAAKNGKVLWLEIEKSLRSGDAPEMLHGLLHWKARDLMQKGSRSWSASETRALSLGLIELLSDARSESLDLGVALERWALGI